MDKIEMFISKVPESMRGIFQRAFSGKSKANAVKAKCLDCCCFNRAEVTNCTIKTCPLWSYRPYQKEIE